MSARHYLRVSGRPANELLARAGLVLAIALGLFLVGASQALAAPLWRLSSRAAPSELAPGGTGLLVVAADNLGDSAVRGATNQVTIRDTLPEGLNVTGGLAGIRARRFYSILGAASEEADWSCSLSGLRQVSCATKLLLPAYEGVEMLIPVEVAEPAGTSTSLLNTLSVEGGETETGATVASASLARALQIGSVPVSFGLEPGGYSLRAENEDGSLDSQAGSHPFQLTSTVDFNQTLEALPVEGQPAVKGLQPAAPALARDLSFNLPPGLLGNVTAVEQCSEVDFATLVEGDINLCQPSSAVGVATVSINVTKPYGYASFAVPLFNLVPAPGEPARFGFEINKVPVVLDTSVRTGGDYGVTVNVKNASETGQIVGSQVTFWGVPGDPRHDSSRGWACLLEGIYINHEQPCTPPDPRSSTPFLTLPTACTGALLSTSEGNAWNDESLSGEFTFENGLGQPLQHLEGCEQLPFSPAIAVQPIAQAEAGQPPAQTSSASTPTGLNVAVKSPQQSTLQAAGLGEADVKSATVTLPEGMQLNPSAANGLQACSEAQVGYLGQGGVDPLSPGASEPLRFTTEKANCPEASKIGSVAIKTPLLDEQLTGSAYLATPAPAGEPGENPFNSLVAIYIVAENQALGLRVKLAGEAQLDERTGQITTNFQNTPQVPFEELTLKLFGGERGPLSTPARCGSYTTTSSFTAWSGGAQEPSALEPFQITSGPEGAPCADPLPFTPAFSAGVTSVQAGAFTAFTLTIAHPDRDQPLSALTMRLPPGVAALLSTVTPCPQPPAGQEWACGPASEIGHSTAWAGLGSEPYALPGTVYLTAGYGGAPFGLLVVTPAVAGPFNLGNIDVRAKINVDPDTAAVTITSEPFPTFVRGIPAQLKQLNVTVDRPSFEFNPTNCSPMRIAGTISGEQGASSAVSSPFQVGGCQGLPFKPKLTASTKGQASKANGANFDVKVESKGLGQANIAKVRLQLPKALPARLTTLQKACTEGAFDTNPASCPEGSVIGHATIHTPVLSNPLTGPAYLVSHGGAAFPDVEFVLQGEGITLVLDGKTQISKQITYSKFESAPDAPFTVFETVLPAGPHSALTTDLPEKAKFNLCKSSLVMPTEIVGQNGAVLKQTTKIALQGCKTVMASKPGKLSRAQLLKRALQRCRKQHKHSKARRVTCEKQARKRFAAKVVHKSKNAPAHR